MVLNLFGYKQTLVTAKLLSSGKHYAHQKPCFSN